MREPRVRTDILQVVKAAIATVVAWAVAALWLGLEQPFLAPWTALLTVHATVVRTFWRGAEAVLATALGLVLARVGGLRTEGVTEATPLFVITAGYAGGRSSCWPSGWPTCWSAWSWASW